MIKIKNSIEVRSPGNDLNGGYKIWVSREAQNKHSAADVQIPGLAPSQSLWMQYQSGKIPWEDFSAYYLRELSAPASQNLIKPLALLSFRKKIVLLCNCVDHLRCPTSILADAIQQCKKTGNFMLNLEAI